MTHTPLSVSTLAQACATVFSITDSGQDNRLAAGNRSALSEEET